MQLLEKLKNEIEKLEKDKKTLSDKIALLLDENRELRNDNTYLDTYSQKMKQILVQNKLVSYCDIKMRLPRHSR
jgi:predicted  nucleic acid-binding Zn-ribbon protein